MVSRPFSRHPGMILAGVQRFKSLDSGLKRAGMTAWNH